MSHEPVPMMPRYERFVAIDWSGARGPRYRGIAVAECGPGCRAPVLVPPPGSAPWTRTAVADWLIDGLRRGPALIGFDFAFSLPFDKAGRYFPEGPATVFDLWALVDEVSRGAPDCLGSPFVDHPDYGRDFWTRGPRPADYVEARRGAELACAAEGCGNPQSPYHLIGSKQVGRGTLAGMRVLQRLRRARPADFAFWPFEMPSAGQSVCVEIYPRLFLRRSGFGQRKIREGAELDLCLERLGSEPVGTGGTLSDHDTDALISAAGLRRLAEERVAWNPVPLGDRARRQEGWIFGVGTGGRDLEECEGDTP